MADWTATKAKRSHVPLMVGIMGPSGGGKTYSALRLAKGIQSVAGGEVFGVDTEQNRMLHYADDPDLTRDGWSFRHVPFGSPFGSLRYLDCLKWCVSQGAKTIIVDSMSHEHAGEGGYLDEHDRDLDKFGGGDERKRERNNMRAWIRPATERKKLILGMLQLDANFIFTFRAKESVKPDGSGGVTELGFMPQAGDEFLYEMTVCCLLMPVAGGVPTWASKMPGEARMIKPAKQFMNVFGGSTRPLDEEHGRGLALWARGSDASPQAATSAPAASALADAPANGAPATPASEPGTAMDDGSRATSGDTSDDPSRQPADWDYGAWASAFNEMLRTEVTKVADFDALWNDPSNQNLRAELKRRDEKLAKSLHAASVSIRKALRSKETAAGEF